MLQRRRRACADDDECAMKPRQTRRGSGASCAVVLFGVALNRDEEHWMYAPSRGRVGGVSVAGGWTDAL